MATVRILICRDCESTETLPPYEGDPRNDTVLEYAVSRHQYPNGERHLGRLYGPVDAGAWNNPDAQKEILKQIWQREGHTGMEPWVYHAVDMLKEDAMQCWRSRQRPATCSDFHSDKKLLVPPTARDRKSEGLAKWDKANPGAQRYLCDYCPIRSVAEQQVRSKLGLYE